MDALGRVWDLRTGRCVYVMQGHVKPVLAIDFHPDWYVLAQDDLLSIVYVALFIDSTSFVNAGRRVLIRDAMWCCFICSSFRKYPSCA